MGLSTITQTAQIGVEATPGTKVAANKKLNSVGFTMSPNPDVQVFRPAGVKYPTVAAMNREWTELTLDGAMTYSEIVYLLAGILEKTTPTVSGTGQKWVFSPSSSAPDSVATYTIEQGSSVRGHRVGYTVLTDLTLSFARDENTISGSAIASAIEDPFTLTAAPTALSLVPITGPEILVYAADTFAALDAAQPMLGTISIEWALSNRFAPAWLLNGQTSYNQVVEIEPTLELTWMLEADASGLSIMPIMRTGQTKFIRIEATGPIIAAGPETYSLTLDTACKITDVGDFSDQDGLYAIEYTLQAFHDPTWGFATNATVVNNLTAL